MEQRTLPDRDEEQELLFPPAEREYEPVHPEPAWRELARKLWAPVVAVGAFVLKFGGVLLKLKVFTTSASMLVSIAAYALLWGWKFAVGLVLLLFVHELGHVLELRRQGVPASAPLFIPFLGAVVGMKQLPADAWREAQVALAGPILGTVGAAVCWALGAALDSDLLVALAFVGFLLNLFNLLPIVPLDGGRAVAAVHPALWLAGLIALAALAVLRPNPILLLVLVLGGLELWRRWQLRNAPEAAAYYRVRPWQRATAGLVYGGLAVLLVLGIDATHLHRTL